MPLECELHPSHGQRRLVTRGVTAGDKRRTRMRSGLGGGQAMDLWSSSSDEEEPAGRSRAESPPPLPAWRSSTSKGVATSGGVGRVGSARGGSHGAASQSPAGRSVDASGGGERGASRGGDGWEAESPERIVALSRGAVPGCVPLLSRFLSLSRPRSLPLPLSFSLPLACSLCPTLSESHMEPLVI